MEYKNLFRLILPVFNILVELFEVSTWNEKERSSVCNAEITFTQKMNFLEMENDCQ